MSETTVQRCDVVEWRPQGAEEHVEGFRICSTCRMRIEGPESTRCSCRLVLCSCGCHRSEGLGVSSCGGLVVSQEDLVDAGVKALKPSDVVTAESIDGEVRVVPVTLPGQGDPPPPEVAATAEQEQRPAASDLPFTSVRNAAGKLGVPQRWLSDQVNAHELPALVVNGRRYVHVEQLEEVLQRVAQHHVNHHRETP